MLMLGVAFMEFKSPPLVPTFGEVGFYKFIPALLHCHYGSSGSSFDVALLACSIIMRSKTGMVPECGRCEPPPSCYCLGCLSWAHQIHVASLNKPLIPGSSSSDIPYPKSSF